MQRISALPRVAAHALILAFAAFMLLAIGCTGAQASPNGQVASISASAFQDALANTSADIYSQVLTTCNPGRDKVRVECNAVAPTQAQLQHSPENDGVGLFTPVRAETTTDQLSGRTPAALTHLDLGIVRT